MYDNVPDDWHMYWTRCEFCGQKYHMSEGGCDCTSNLDPCACGKCNWNIFGDTIYCMECYMGPGEEIEEDDDETYKDDESI